MATIEQAPETPPIMASDRIALSAKDARRAFGIIGKAKAGVRQRRSYPALDYIIVSTAHHGTMIATDMEVEIGATLTMHGIGEIAVPWEQMKLALSGAKDDLTIYPGSIVRDDGARFTWDAHKAHDAAEWYADVRMTRHVPFLNLPVEGKRLPSAQIIAGDYFAAANSVWDAASSDETRPVLTGILHELRDDGYMLAATDSYRLHIARADTGVIVTTLPQDTMPIIPANAVRAAAHMHGKLGANPADVLDMRFSAGYTPQHGAFYLTEYADGITSVKGYVAFRMIGGQYPNVTALTPDTFAGWATFNRDDAAQLASWARSIGKSLNAQDATRITLDGYTIMRLSVDSIGAQLDVPADMGGGDAIIGVNTRFLADAIAAMPDDTIMLHHNGALRPIVLRPADPMTTPHTVTAIVMPVRIA